MKRASGSRPGWRNICAQHVNHPGAFGIDDIFVGVRGFGRIEAETESQRANIAGGLVGAGSFFDELLAITLEPDTQGVIGISARVGEEQGQIVGDGFVNPLIAIA